mmetsp:Transcript_68745/g.161633  ORF Transcript_68745/g.161633 Transcript_68745/m.161633 type:complete len:83 (+) Transcript_68745:1-249(+)
MLSTDLHSSHVRSHMTEQQFKRQLRGIRGDGKDYPEDFVVALFREVQRQVIGSLGHSTRPFPGTTSLTKSAAKVPSEPVVPS